MKKIAIIYATAGIGHKKAAMAVKQALDEIAPKEVTVTLIDALDYTNAFFKWTYLQSYLFMVNKLPLVWGFFYYLTDSFLINLPVSVLRRLNNHCNSGKLRAYLQTERPDVVISTHFFASEVISEMKKNGTFAGQLITVITDYRSHAWWVAGGNDAYIVAGDMTRDDFIRWGVPSEKIRVLGIPCEPVFTKLVDRAKIFAASGLKEGIFTVLIIGGGFGVGPIEEIVRTVAGTGATLQIVTVCGHNQELVKSLETFGKTSPVPIKVLGFVNNVYEYMSIADVLISKAGGISVTESLAKELPMIIIAPILGQETRNTGFLVENGAAVLLREVGELKWTIEELAAGGKASAMKAAIGKIRQPKACYEIARLGLEAAGVKG